MGDAVRDGEVPSTDPDKTIDGEAAPGDLSPPRAPAMAEEVAALGDYPELLPVERHHYALGAEIAKGGMGRVVEARDLRIGRQVAIKELLPRHRDAARRFEREARITARLQHPSIVHVYEAGVWPGGEPFYAMPKIAGRSLDKVVAERASLNERLSLLPHAIAVADALAYAHNANIIHRDLKPANVLVGEFGETVVIDWGLAKDLGSPSDPKESLQLRLRAASDETVSGSIVGTPAYMAPEQAHGEADQRADVYALGALLYKILAGMAPYTGATSQEVLDKLDAGPPPPLQEREPGVPPDLCAIVAKAMARDPERRYASAAELAQDLKRFETGQLVAAYRYTRGQLVWRWLRRNRFPVSVAAVALGVLGIVAAVSVQSIVAERNKAEARRAALLEEHGREALLAGQAGPALAYLVGAAGDGRTGGARGFLIADAMRPFAAELAHLDAGPGEVLIAVSPDLRRLATAGEHGVKLWSDGDRAIPAWRPEAIRSTTLAAGWHARVVAFDHAGARLAAAGDDGVTRVWTADGTTVAGLRVPGKPAGAVLDLVFSPDDRWLATAGSDGRARIWDLSTRTALVASCPQAGPIVSVRFSSNGERVVTASEDKLACVFSARSGHVVSLLRGHGGPVNAAVWAHGDAWILTASDDETVRGWNPELGKPLWGEPLLREAPAPRFELSSDGGYLLTAGSDQVARIWDLTTGTTSDVNDGLPKERTRLEGHSATIVAASFGANDELVATGSDNLARLWDAGTGQLLATYEHGDVVDAVAFAGPTRLVTGSRDGTARIWDARALGISREPGPVSLESSIHAIAVANGVLAAGTEGSLVTLWHQGKKTVLAGHLGRVLAVAFSGDGKRLVTAGDDPRPLVWDVVTGRQTATLAAHPGPIADLAISHDNRVAVVADDGVYLEFLDGTAPPQRLDAGGADVTRVAFQPGGSLLVGAAVDGSLVLWDLARDGRAVAHVGARRGHMAITSIAFSPDGSALAVAGGGAPRIYPVVGTGLGKQLTVLEEQPGLVNDVAFTRGGWGVITAGVDGIARIYDAEKGKLLGTRRAQGEAIALAVDGDTLWIASADQTIVGWELEVDGHDVAYLQDFVTEHVPERLDDHDVVRARLTGATDE